MFAFVRSWHYGGEKSDEECNRYGGRRSDGDKECTAAPAALTEERWGADGPSGGRDSDGGKLLRRQFGEVYNEERDDGNRRGERIISHIFCNNYLRYF